MAKIIYNGTITEVAEGKTAVITCSGKKMPHSVIVTGACKVDYNGISKVITENQSAVIPGGKKMKDAIRVAVTKPTYTLSGTWVFTDETLPFEMFMYATPKVDIAFSSNGHSFYAISFSNRDGDFEMYYWNATGAAKAADDYVFTYFKTITFDGEQTVSKEFYEWFVANAVKSITFIIGNTTYQAESGMTWGEWVESDYNTEGWFIATQDRICRINASGSSSTIAEGSKPTDAVYAYEAIKDGYSYVTHTEK